MRSYNLSLRVRQRIGAQRERWTPEKREIARDMRANNATLAEIAAEVAMSCAAVSKETQGIKPDQRGRGSGELTTRIAIEVLDDRDRRRAAAHRQNLTSILFGDPPPGYSALDRRQQA